MEIPSATDGPEESFARANSTAVSQVNLRRRKTDYTACIVIDRIVSQFLASAEE